MISKNIFQSWYTTNIPQPIQNSINQMRRLNPEYSYYLFKDEDVNNYVNKSNYDNFLEAYNKLDIWASKIDIWRYLILYNEGGVYLDIDATIYASLNPLLNDGYSIITREGNPGKFV